MPCNLAVTITKAAVLPDHLVALLTPEVIEQVVTAYLQHHPVFKDYLPLRSKTIGNVVTFFVSNLAYRITITGNQIAINFPPYAQDKATKLSGELVTLLSKTSDRLFARQVQKSLAAKFGNVQQQTAKVDNEGEQQTVTVFTLEV